MNRDYELNKLAENIKRIRHKKGLSQEKLAYMCDFDRTYISLLERSKRNPTYLNLLKLSNGLGIHISLLFEKV